MGGATLPSGAGAGAMAFPSAAEPNPLAQGLRGQGPEQFITQITPPTSNVPTGLPPASPPTQPTAPNYNFPTIQFGAPTNPGYYWQLNPQGQLQLLQAPQDSPYTTLPGLDMGIASQLGLQGSRSGNTQYFSGMSQQVSPTNELSFLQQQFPYAQNPNLPAGAVQPFTFPQNWTNSKMQQWSGPFNVGL